MNKIVWNGLGYTPGRYSDIIAVGTSVNCNISPNYYFNNYYDLPDYKKAIDNNAFPIYSAYKLNFDDIVRREVIYKLRNYSSVNISYFEQTYKLNFKEYFKDELIMLREFHNDGVLINIENSITLSEIGKDFVQHVCSVFDIFSKH
ncbi:MAG: hypothetical protein WCI84_05660 [Bacteroidota bacterium]